jgi:hypothetical protein
MATDTDPWADKDPSAVVDYSLDWSPELATSETIVTAAHTVGNGLVLDSEDHTDTATTVWLSAGNLGETALVRCFITTNQGREMVKSKELNILRQ